MGYRIFYNIIDPKTQQLAFDDVPNGQTVEDYGYALHVLDKEGFLLRIVNRTHYLFIAPIEEPVNADN